MKKITLFLLSVFCCLAILAQIKDVKHVILIGTDGLGSFILNEHNGDFPHLEKMMKEGASSLETRSVLPSSSAVNWASILMGAGPELHGFTDWGSQKPELPSRVIGKYGLFPGIFGLIRDKYPQAETAAFYSWPGIGYLFEKQAATVDGNIPDDDAKILKESTEHLKNKKPLFSFIYFSQPDGAGHGKGWGTPEYLEECKKIDTYIGEIFKTLKEAGMDDNSVILFISDHGGINKGHGGKTMQEMQVPYILWGKSVKKDYKIDESIMVYDNASTIAYILGLTQPQVWIGRAIKSAFK